MSDKWEHEFWNMTAQSWDMTVDEARAFEDDLRGFRREASPSPPPPTFKSRHADVSPELARMEEKFVPMAKIMKECRKLTADPEEKPVYVLCQRLVRPLMDGVDKRNDKHVKGMIELQLDELIKAYENPDTNAETGERETSLHAMRWVLDKYPNEVSLEVLTHHKLDLARRLGLEEHEEEFKFLGRFHSRLFNLLHPLASIRSVADHIHGMNGV